MFNKMRPFIIILLLGIAGCSSGDKIISLAKQDQRPSYSDFREFTDWESGGPIKFITYLKTTNISDYLVYGTSSDWIKDKDIPELMKLIDSEEPCAGVQMVISSYLAGRSTVGNEAAFLIEGFIKGSYPPALDSTRWKPNRDKIREWWREYSQQNN